METRSSGGNQGSFGSGKVSSRLGTARMNASVSAAIFSQYASRDVLEQTGQGQFAGAGP
jgi:hypothetical protein